MAFPYLKKIILLPILILLVFGFFCHESFAQGLEVNSNESYIEHQQSIHRSDCGALGIDCVIQDNQFIVATVQNMQSINQTTKKTLGINPVFLLVVYNGGPEGELDKRPIFYKSSSPDTSPYQSWPVGLARSHLS